MTRQRIILSLKTTYCVCLGLLCASAALGQEGDRSRQQSGDAQQQQTDQTAGSIELPQFLKELDLDNDQKEQIKQALRQHNQKLQQTWKDFHKQHAKAVNLEAAWVAAVRDSLSEEDQRKFDQQRMQQREMTRHSQGDTSQQRGSAAQRRQDAREGRQQEARESAQDRQAERRQRRQERTERQQARPGSQEQSERSQSVGEPSEYSFVVITTFSPERFLQGTNQSSQQEQQCSEACREYKQALTSAWKDLHRLHYELVQIEADRIQAVEEQLTEDQLNKLRESRQKPQSETAAADSPSQRNQ